MPLRKSSKLSITVPEAEETSNSSPSPSHLSSGDLASRRTARACDQCRKTKTRCEHHGDPDNPCRSCLLAGYACTFFEPLQKRGPPKGYLSALENRLHEAEALLGVIILSKDLRAKSLVADLTNDSLANSIINRVSHGVFGPMGRVALHGTVKGRAGSLAKRPTDSRKQHMNSREVAMMGIEELGKKVFTTPNNAWQDYLCQRLSIESSHVCEISQQILKPSSFVPKALPDDSHFCFLSPRSNDRAEERLGTSDISSALMEGIAEQPLCYESKNTLDHNPTISHVHFAPGQEGLPYDQSVIHGGLEASLTADSVLYDERSALMGWNDSPTFSASFVFPRLLS